MTRQKALETIRNINQLIEWAEANEGIENPDATQEALTQREDALVLCESLKDSGYDYEELIKSPPKVLCCECCGKGLERDSLICKLCYREICSTCNIATEETGPVCVACHEIGYYTYI